MSIERLEDDIEVDKTPFKYSTHFMGMRHNYYCSVCKEKPGVQSCNTGELQPCWDCQKTGWRLIKLNWLDRLLKRGEP